jgi:hypothetical protein
MRTKLNTDNLAIVKYYDTSTIDGLREQLRNMMLETSIMNQEVLRSLGDPFMELHKRTIQRDKEEYLINSGDLSYLEMQREIQDSLKDLAKKLYPPKCIEKNKELLDTFKERWGEAIYISLEIDYEVKEYAKLKFILNPYDTVQYQKLTCRDLLENFKFVEKIPLDESEYIPVKEELYKIFMRLKNSNNPIQKGYDFGNSYQYKFFSVVNNHPVTFVTMIIFLSLFVGITLGCAVKCATDEFGTGLCK